MKFIAKSTLALLKHNLKELKKSKQTKNKLISRNLKWFKFAMAEKEESKPDLSKLSEENIKNFNNQEEKIDGKKWVSN